ncbi:arsenate reductase [Hyaloraphidium curvatum]|nr:arsenate reductase [Hyaloraphidium curvatum]
MDIFPSLEASLDAIPASRLGALKELASHAASRLSADQPAHLVFISTHNSRRSHIGQVMAAAAAEHAGLANVRTYSAGTEVTAFNANAVDALRAHGCTIDVCTDQELLSSILGSPVESSGIDLEDPTNPVYLVRPRPSSSPSICFSKTLAHPWLPKSGFAAVMTCTSADAACPVVAGAKVRIALPYEDPKKSDGTGQEANVYGEKCREVGREMLWVMMEAKKEMVGY